MNAEEMFRKNLERWKIIYPAGADVIAAMESEGTPNDLSLCQTKSGQFNLKRETIPGNPFYFYSQNPSAESEEWFAGLKLEGVEVIYVYGVGLGYAYDAAQKWLKKSSSHYLVFFEDDPQVLRHLFRTQRGHDILNDKQVLLYLITAEKKAEFFSSVTLYFTNQKFIVTALYSYMFLRQALFAEFNSQIAFFCAMHEMWFFEAMKSFGSAFYKNYVPNFLNMFGSYFADGLLGKFKGVPAIICGAGPSLNKNIDVLATLSDRALIFAGGTALNALNARGIMPHFGAGIDPNPDQFTRLIMNEAYEVPFIYSMRMQPDALSMVHGDKLYVTSNLVGGARWMETKLGIKGVNFNDGFNVLNFCTVAATALGCNPVICVGIDLAYSHGDSYAQGVISHPIHIRSKTFRTKREEEELISKPDIYGTPVNTLWKWIAESGWYSDFAQKHPEVHLINSTEGGIGFPGVENIDLAVVGEKYLTKQYDLLSTIHLYIQNSPLPAPVDRPIVSALFDEMYEGLVVCKEILEQIFDLYLKECSRSEDVPSHMDKINELIAQLDDNDVYKDLLLQFSISFSHWASLPIIQLKWFRDVKTPEELRRAAAEIEAQRYQFIRNATKVGVYKLKSSLADAKEGLPVSSEDSTAALVAEKKDYPLPVPRSDEHYSFNEKHYKISDPEENIDYVEDLTQNSPLRSEVLRYPSGVLQMQSYYKGAMLHGPVTCYGENNNILAQSWFVDGKHVGKVRLYFQNGSLYCLQRYRNGLKNGLQQYFYAEGLPRTIISYKNGVLDGDVILFFPDGHMFRRLHFVDGKKEGSERIWDQRGRLYIETNYEDGRPVGVTRTWHNNGALAKEIHYDASSDRVSYKEWDKAGAPADDQEDSDYYDQVNKQTETITHSLEDVVGKLAVIAPLFSKFEDASAGENRFADDLKMLEDKLAHLKDIESKFKAQRTEDEQNLKEAIWKSPAAKKALLHQIDDMKNRMDQDMKVIEDGMKKALSKLKNNNPS